MNERIQELSYQCWYNDPDTGKEEFNRTKFAELIVRECCAVADSTVGGDYAYHPSHRIKQHFGVAE
jgi:hypothetical protein